MTGSSHIPASSFLAFCLLVISLTCSAAWVRADTPIFYAPDGNAIQGYDVVTYFTNGEPQPGNSDFSVMWKGAVWRFISAENRERFEANPRAYAPQYGGYCAYGVSKGFVVQTDPMVFRIQDDKLYLIHNQSVWSKWAQDIPGHIAAADANWPAVLTAQ